MQREITLGADPATGEGGITVPVYGQRLGHLHNKLGRFINDLADSGEQLQGDTIDDVLSFLGSRVYKLLIILIPKVEQRLPEHEFFGYQSREALEAGDYDPAEDTSSPSIVEIRTAFQAGIEASGLDVFAYLKGAAGLVDPTMLRARVNLWLAEQIDSTSTTSPSSPSGNGGSPASTTSGPTSPTSTPSEDSHSLASVA